MEKTVETFVLGSGKAPEWLISFMSNGIVQKVENDDEVFYRINTPTGIKKAVMGDVVIRTKSGISLVPADKAEKFKIIPKKVQRVEKSVENNNE